MRLEEVSDRLEFLESQCAHGPWKLAWDSSDWGQTPRCVKCGAPVDHQLDPKELVE